MTRYSINQVLQPDSQGSNNLCDDFIGPQAVQWQLSSDSGPRTFGADGTEVGMLSRTVSAGRTWVFFLPFNSGNEFSNQQLQAQPPTLLHRAN